MSYSFTIDPNEVLGVSPQATLQEIRDAYRIKAKKHHPDGGGDAWAFRVVAQAYQVLSTARVAGRAVQEFEGTARSESQNFAGAGRQEESEHARPGVRDPFENPHQVVAIEMFFIRFAIEDPSELFSRPPEERNLSCCICITWPTREPDAPRPASDVAEATVTALTKIFREVAKTTGAHASYSRPEDLQFTGWMSYPTAVRASEAFDVLKKKLNAHGLRVRQWSREMIIAREPN